MKITLCQLGARLHYATAVQLYRHGMLARLYTDLYCTAGLRQILEVDIISTYGGDPIKRLLGRYGSALPDDVVWHFPWFGFKYAARLRNAKTRAEIARACLGANQMFERKVVRAGFGDCDSVFAFNTAAAGLFRAAKSKGFYCILEQTIAPFEIEHGLISHEYCRRDLTWELDKFTRQLIDREREEWALADVIIAGSQFVAKSLEACGVASNKIAIVPYGVTGPQLVEASVTQNAAPYDGRRPLKIIMVGHDMLRKGVPYLVDAVRELGPKRVHATIVGTCKRAIRSRCGEAENVKYAGSFPSEQIYGLLRESDVFLLPSICEGSATAIYEALACGIPVICTENAGSIITNGEEGFIVPIQDSEAIRAALEKIIHNPGLLAAMNVKALQTAKLYTVQNYGERLIQALKHFEGNG